MARWIGLRMKIAIVFHGGNLYTRVNEVSAVKKNR